MQEADKDLQEKHLEILTRNGGFQFTETFFPYTSGEIGPYYVQSAVVLNNGQDYRVAIMDMTSFVIDSIFPDIISGGESRDWVFSLPVASGLGLPHMMIYKDGKVIGPDVKNKILAHIADLSNEGSSPRDLWIPAIRDREGRIKDIFFYVDRLEEGVKVMKELNLDSHAMVPLNENAWGYLLNQNVINQEVYKSLRNRMDDKDKWARRMLRSKEGIEEFIKLAQNPKTRSKADKIIIKGYSDMKDELVGILDKRADLDMDAWKKGL